MSCIANPAFWVYLIVLIGGVMLIRTIGAVVCRAFFGFPAPIPQTIMIILWIVIACAGVYFLFRAHELPVQRWRALHEASLTSR